MPADGSDNIRLIQPCSGLIFVVDSVPRDVIVNDRSALVVGVSVAFPLHFVVMRAEAFPIRPGGIL
jgi:hypothetical protein